MDAIKYFEAKANMTDNCGSDCELCPLGRRNNTHSCACNDFEIKYPKEAVAIVEKWQKENMFRVPKDTPIDAKVLVSNDGNGWVKRHFAGFDGETMLAWDGGTTSHTGKHKTPWKSMKIAEEEA